MENPNKQTREIEEAKKYLQKPIRGRFLPTFAMAVAGLGASYCAYRYMLYELKIDKLKKQQNSSVVDGNHSDPVVVPAEDSKKKDAKNVNNAIKKTIDPTHDRPF